jgi:hypothetical protein
MLGQKTSSQPKKAKRKKAGVEDENGNGKPSMSLLSIKEALYLPVHPTLGGAVYLHCSEPVAEESSAATSWRLEIHGKKGGFYENLTCTTYL